MGLATGRIVRSARGIGVALAAMLGLAGTAQAAPPVAPAAPSTAAPATGGKPADILHTPGRPRIGLVLGGGGAKGFAHIGVIEELERQHIPVDVISGTSMGAVIGSLYAQGGNAEKLSQVAHGIDWVTVFNDTVHRDELSFRRKSEERNILLPYRLSFKDGKPVLPKGVLGGQKLFATVQELLVDNVTLTDFDKLPIPYRAVATNIVNGQAVVMGSGNFSTAVFASMSIPAGFPPVEREGLLLVDGGISDNVPINVARDMGADVIIAVDVGSKPLKQDQITNVVNVLSQMTALLGYQAVVDQIASLKGQDVLIRPDIEGIGTTSFQMVDPGIERGRAAARAAADKLAPLALNDADWAAYLAAKAARVNHQPVVVQTVELKNTSTIPDKYVKPLITTKPGDTLNGAVMARDVNNIFALDEFSRVQYDVTGTPANYGLLVDARGDPTIAKYFQFGLLIASDFGRSGDFELAVGYTDRSFLGTGAEFRGYARVGSDVLFDVSLYKQFGKFFVEPRAYYHRYDTQVVQVGSETSSGTLQYAGAGMGLDAGLVFGNWGELRTGIDIGGINPLYDSINTGVPLGWNRDIAWRLGFSVDTLDSLLFPTTGNYGSLEFVDHTNALGGQFTRNELRFNAIHAMSWGRNALILGARFGITEHAVNDFIGQYQLGGFLNLSGLPRNSLIGQQMVLGRAIFFHRLSGESPIMDLPLYVGGSLETGNVFADTSDISFGDLRVAASAFVAADTPIGPVFLAYGHASGGNNAIYLIIGRVF